MDWCAHEVVLSYDRKFKKLDTFFLLVLLIVMGPVMLLETLARFLRFRGEAILIPI